MTIPFRVCSVSTVGSRPQLQLLSSCLVFGLMLHGKIRGQVSALGLQSLMRWSASKRKLQQLHAAPGAGMHSMLALLRRGRRIARRGLRGLLIPLQPYSHNTSQCSRNKALLNSCSRAAQNMHIRTPKQNTSLCSIGFLYICPDSEFCFTQQKTLLELDKIAIHTSPTLQQGYAFSPKLPQPQQHTQVSKAHKPRTVLVLILFDHLQSFVGEHVVILQS